ncbi:MAG: TIM44-like domain-containing protein [Burkholderia sp.]|nr:MAG: hypothetical protein E5299_00327 [Burkholderia gladioli]
MSDFRSFNNRSKQPRPWAHRIGTLFMVGLLTVGIFASPDAEARRMGGGRSFGRQSQMVQQRQAMPPAAPAAWPVQQRGAKQPNRSRWLGPIAGLATGLGIAALLSHFGLGGAFSSIMAANLIMVALLAFIGIWIVHKLMNRTRKPDPAYAGAGSSMNRGGGYDTGSNGGYARQNHGYAPVPLQPASSSYANEAVGVFSGGTARAGLAAAGMTPSVPVGFDSEAFVRNAKVNFIRLQAAWDAGNMTDIREFTTPEMFAEVKVDLASRGADKNQTDVVQLEAELFSVEEHSSQYGASVRFHGLIREAPGASVEPFEEVWNFTKSGNEGWMLAGIQQINLH